MEAILVVLGLIVLVVMLLLYSDNVAWKTKDAGEAWFSSRNIKREIRKISLVTKMDGMLLLGLAFMPMLLLLALVIVQAVAIYRFTKYVEDRNDFLILKGNAMPVTESAIRPGETIRGGEVTNRQPPPETTRRPAGGGASRRSGSEKT